MTAFVTRCVRCRQQRCICDAITPTVLRTRFVIVRHCAELSRVSNTGHFARLALGCELHDYGGLEPFDEARLPTQEGTWLLFPDGGEPPQQAPERVIVLDGSWSQARRMRQKIQALRNLPTLTLPPPDPARRRLRHSVHSYGMSTLEAIARVVERYEGAAQAAPLDALHEVITAPLRSRRRTGPAPRPRW